MAGHGTESSITVRKARLDDYDAVLKIIEDAYDGCDYIPVYYQELINDPDFHYYVAEVDGHLAALEGVILLDEEQTIMARSARVKEGYAGKGVLKHIRQRVTEDFKNIPTLKRLRTSCTNVVRLVRSRTFQQENKTLLQRDLLTFEAFETDSITRNISDSEREVNNISLAQFSQLLDIKSLKDELFPEGIFSAVSWFFDTLSSNMKFLEKLNPYVVVTHHLYQHLQQPGSTEELLHSTHQQGIPFSSGVIGIGTYYFCTKWLVYFVDVFGMPSKGKEEEEISAMFRRHVVHMQSILRNGDVKSVLFGLSKTEGTPGEWFKNALIPLGFKIFTEYNSKYKHQYYFEQDF